MTQPYADFVRWRSCGRKRRHDTKLAANAAVLGHWARGQWAWAYPCRLCNGWHLTTDPTTREAA